MPATPHSGGHRVRFAELFDAELRPHNERFRTATNVQRADHVLDIGCGTGESTRDAGRAAVDGAALGVDISLLSVQDARRRAEAEGLTNVSFEQADAQVHAFRPGAHDVCISRFGTMFFADPTAAFTNIRRALRSGARLVLLVWQAREANEWATAVRAALAIGDHTPPVPITGDPFALADQAGTQAILAASGFDEIGFVDVDAPVYYGPDADTAYDFVSGMSEPTTLLDALEPAQRQHAQDQLRQLFADRTTDSGVLLGSRAWIVTARAS